MKRGVRQHEKGYRDVDYRKRSQGASPKISRANGQLASADRQEHVESTGALCAKYLRAIAVGKRWRVLFYEIEVPSKRMSCLLEVRHFDPAVGGREDQSHKFVLVEMDDHGVGFRTGQAGQRWAV